MTIGMVLLGVQLLYLSRLGADASFWNLLPGFVVGGLGMALAMTPTAAAATRAVPVRQGRRRLRRAERDAAGRRLARDRADGRDRRRLEASGRPGVDGFVAGFERALLVAA